MTIWIVFAVLTALAALCVLVPLMRARRRAVSAALHDVEVYKAQLGEVERDLERGLVTAEAADAAPERLRTWSETIETADPSLRAGAYYLLGLSLAQGDPAAAAIEL